MWSEKCDSNLSFAWDCLRRFVLVIMFDHLIVNFVDRLISLFDEWCMLILDYRVTYVCSRLVERRLWWDVIKLDETSHQTHCERLIKLDESDSSNLMSENVISSNLTKTIHQAWRKKRHLIKSNERVISSNFWEERQFFYFLMSKTSAATLDVKNLILRKILFENKCLYEIVMISERSWWKLDADITQLFLVKKSFKLCQDS
jgi:hypothetical protein